MPDTPTKDLRNIALVGHGATGKTTLADLMLFKSKGVTRLGSVDDKTSMFDSDEDEREHRYSITSAVGHTLHHHMRINIIDTPGYPDFIGQVYGALDAVETAVVVISATAGVEVNTRRAFDIATQNELGHIIVINRCDAENVDFERVLLQVQEVFGERCIPVTVPDQCGANMSKVLCTMHPDGTKGVIDPAIYHQQLMDAIIEADATLMEKYLAGEKLTPDEIVAGTHQAIAHGSLVPIFCTSAKKDIGVAELLDGIADWVPSPDEVEHKAVDGQAVHADPDAPLVAQVFKTRIDPFVARMNFIRIYSGTLKKDEIIRNQTTGKDVKLTGLSIAQGSHLEHVDHLRAGDIAVVTKVDGLHIGDVLSTDGRLVQPIHFPQPMVSLAVEPKTTADQQKISGALQKLHDEDPTFASTHDEQTHELIVHGMSDLHLRVLLDRIQKREKVGINVHAPKIPYREACMAQADGSYRHKKQSGGAGQFAEVHLRVRPMPRDVQPEEFFTSANFHCLRTFHYDPTLNSAFVDCVSGGSVPNQFIPAVEKGVKERMQRGCLAGFQVQDVVVELHFGKDHPVDSNENAFRTAGALCFRDVFRTAQPVLLEPLVKLEVLIPGDKLGDITSDLNARRARMEGIDSASGGYQIVRATAPLATVQDYSRHLSSMTGGKGSFSLEVTHYEMLPANEQQKVLAANKLVDEEH